MATVQIHQTNGTSRGKAAKDVEVIHRHYRKKREKEISKKKDQKAAEKKKKEIRKSKMNEKVEGRDPKHVEDSGEPLSSNVSSGQTRHRHHGQRP